ncbi:MAG: aldehyde dehydrogenase [Planctomycetes bacterium]|nr:aldehyde dehydrogenase [Planctomycetota bacterium]
MLHLSVLRWGEPYISLDKQKVFHFATGEPVAEVSQANGGLIERDLRQSRRARRALLEIPCAELVKMMKKAGELFMTARLPMGDGTQAPEEFVRAQSATAGLPEHMCRKNMEKLQHVLASMDRILDALTRGLDLSFLSAGHGIDREGRLLSYQAQAPVLGMVLPSNSPGVHVLWLPVIPLQIGLALKPGPQEPWTPYRMAEAMFQAGIPRNAIALYPGEAEAGAAVVNNCRKSLIFGGLPTVERYKGNPAVQVHGPGYSKILFGDDQVGEWEAHLDMMEESVFANSGRGCINCSGIWVPRHGRAIAEVLARRLAVHEPLPPAHPEASLAAFTVPGQAQQISAAIDQDLKAPGVEEMTAKHRKGPRLIARERCAYLLPTVVYCDSPEPAIARKEYMFPFVAVVECPQEKMLESIGPTLVATAVTRDEKFRRDLIEATSIDRLNLGPIPTTQLNWLQPHEGNIVDFLYRPRAFQIKNS